MCSQRAGHSLGRTTAEASHSARMVCPTTRRFVKNRESVLRTLRLHTLSVSYRQTKIRDIGDGVDLLRSLFRLGDPSFRKADPAGNTARDHAALSPAIYPLRLAHLRVTSSRICCRVLRRGAGNRLAGAGAVASAHRDGYRTVLCRVLYHALLLYLGTGL